MISVLIFGCLRCTSSKLSLTQPQILGMEKISPGVARQVLGRDFQPRWSRSAPRSVSRAFQFLKCSKNIWIHSVSRFFFFMLCSPGRAPRCDCWSSLEADRIHWDIQCRAGRNFQGLLCWRGLQWTRWWSWWWWWWWWWWSLDDGYDDLKPSRWPMIAALTYG